MGVKLLVAPLVITILMSSFLTSLVSALVFIAAASTTDMKIGKDDDICLAMYRMPKARITRCSILEPWVESMSPTLPHIPTYYGGKLPVE